MKPKRVDAKTALKDVLKRARVLGKKHSDPEEAAQALAAEVTAAGYVTGVLAERAALCMAQDMIHKVRQGAILTIKAPPPNPDRSTPEVLAGLAARCREGALRKWAISSGKCLADCTAADLRAEEAKMRQQAQGCTVNAMLYGRLAEPMDTTQTVSEVWNNATFMAELRKAQAAAIVTAARPSKNAKRA